MQVQKTESPVINVKKKEPKIIHLLISLVLLIGIMCLPTPDGLTVAGQRMIAVIVFAIYVWITEAISYAISAIAIIFFMIIALGLSPDPANPGQYLGTLKAIPIAMSGFVNSGWVLVAAGIFMAEGIKFTGLDKRIALNVLNVVGASPRKIIGGIILLGFILAFIIPSVAARAATIVPLTFGFISALNIDRKSNFARYLMLAAGMVSPIAGFMLLTAGATNPLALSFIRDIAHNNVTWGEWAIIAAPLAIVIGILLYLLIIFVGRIEKGVIPGGKEYIKNSLKELGGFSPSEKRVAVIFGITIILWMTEALHHIDSNTVAVLAVLLIFSPYIGIATWKELSVKADWGTIVLFGAGISIGVVLLKTGAAVWLATAAMGKLGLASLSPAMILVVIAVPLLIIRMAFASIAAFVSTGVPAVLGFLISLNDPDIPLGYMTLLTTFLMYYSFLLPVNTPSALMAYSTDTYELKDMLKVGIPLTILAYGTFVLFLFTYWHWLGII